MFARMTIHSVDAAHVAQIATLIWIEINAALAPIIGQSGVDALLKRSLYLSRELHPSLAELLINPTPADLLQALQALLGAQRKADALVVNTTLLQNFQNLLDTLIGASLTERLLRPVWDIPPSGNSAQDITS
jgi:hypothetical protein